MSWRWFARREVDILRRLDDELVKIDLACGERGRRIFYRSLLDDFDGFDRLWFVDDFDGFDRIGLLDDCLLYTSPSPRDLSTSRMPSSA